MSARKAPPPPKPTAVLLSERESFTRLNRLAELDPFLAVAFTADRGWHLAFVGDLDAAVAAADLREVERARGPVLVSPLGAEGGWMPCGTRAAAMRHRRRGQSLCSACAEAERAHSREQKRLARERRRAS